ncbi:MAG: site-specific integrase [Proteobacteria bacterium]|nr:site-specific integrase [Pseudomonadota bacterium]
MKKPKKEYSDNTKRQATQYPGVYQRRSEKTHGMMDTCFDISYKKDGKKTWEKVGWASDGYTSKLAAQVRADRIRRLQHGEELPQEKPKAPLLGDVAKKYLEWVQQNRANKGRDIVNRYALHIKPRFEKKRMDEITPFALEKMKIELQKQGYAGQSVKHCLVMVREIFNKAIQWNLWQGDNPVSKIKMPAIQNQRERFLSYDEADMLFTELKKVSDVLHNIALMALHTGMRAGEVFSLRWYDIDFKNDLITVRDPKNKNRRTAFLTGTIKGMLQSIPEGNPEEYIFKNKRHGGKINEVSNAFSKVVDTIGLNKGIEDARQKITFHSLRHTFCSWLALQGESIMTIRDLAGHKSISMTMRYSHLIPDEKRKAAARLEAAFNQSKESNIIQLNET